MSYKKSTVLLSISTAILLVVTLVMALYGVRYYKGYESTIKLVKHSREQAMIRQNAELTVVEAERDEALELLRLSNKNLSLLYTFAKTGIKAETLEDVRHILALASNLPIGSPFQGDFIITSPFGARDESLWNGNGFHAGIDIIPVDGNSRAEIFLTADATIIEFGISDTYGKYIIVETEHGYRMKYAHLSTIFYQSDDGKVKGILLKKGTRIALMGSTGFSFGAHLHLEIHIFSQDENKYVQLDPEEILYYIGD